MKKIFTILFLFIVLVVNGQDFHRYEIKSGRIVYQINRFFLHSDMHPDTNGKPITKSEWVPYVAEQREYYWDDYGNVSRNIVYQISGPFGKPLPEKKKLYEQLWKGNHRYYFKDGKVTDDPFYLREECLKNKNLFELTGWFKILYPNAKLLGKEQVSGKEGSRYIVSIFREIVVWKELVLKDINYSTNGKGSRRGKDSEKTAIKIQISYKYPHGFFNPQWLRKHINKMN